MTKKNHRTSEVPEPELVENQVPEDKLQETKVEKILKYEEKFKLSSYSYPYNIFSEINRDLANAIKAHLDRAAVDKERLELFQKLNKTDEFLAELKFPNLRFVLSSYGGSVFDANSICAAFEQAKKNGFVIEIHATGTIMSAGVPIFCSGSKGFRFSDPYTVFMIHNISNFMHGQIPDLRNELEFMKWLEEAFFNIVLKNSKIGKKRLDDMLKYPIDKFFSANEALSYGIVDKIV